MATQMNKPLVPPTANFFDNVSKTTYNFPFNINSLNWTYQLNTSSYSTIGGRVVQLLSNTINSMSLQGEAGSRANLIKLYENFKSIQDNQNQHQTSMILNIPSQGLSFEVWLSQMQIGWGVETVTYMYSMTLEVAQDISSSSTLSDSIVNDALNRISQGIGFNSNYVGFTTQSVNITL